MFPALLWLLSRPHDAHDADDAGSWGAAGRLRGAVNPKQNAQNTRCGQCLWFNDVFDGFSWVFDLPCLNQAKMGSQLR